MQKIDYSLVSRITERCNLNCDYCYLDTKKNKDMSLDVLEDLIYNVFKINESYAHFTWVGGEPLLRNQAFFEKIIDYSNKYNLKNIPCSHSIQTNGYYLNKNRFNKLKKLGFKIGISYDGFQYLQEKHRTNKKKNKTILKNIKDTDQGVGLISVLTKDSVKFINEIYTFLKTYANFAKVNFYSPTGAGLKSEKNLLPSKTEAKKMYAELYQLWKNDDSGFILRPHRDIIRSFFTGLPISCEYSAVSCYKILSSDSEGNIYNCSRAVHFPEMRLGNISEGLENLIGNNVHRLILKRYLKLKKETKDPWFKLSAGGCPIEALSHEKDFMKEAYYAGEIRQDLFKLIKEDLKDENTRRNFERKVGIIK